ncbi:hypothetical protein GUITHDRAFT_113549 [Guillardia theta CCMP2712]|uniref:RWP-RK domain-containing protein n=1 Tax=Guillardia theta (strain CCMP2712) TaxID=905079 RepID=L1IVN6_GUITC|nr:hypothetical protein GUITHDRAFT_113549 [Guillardia theta CCMP2712]EKX40308.1 hypothetical protein GUITHDRAFT_113549 [Guillardia theta CCMP2712]|eukprot:XP_005827288.1 hypothetical protein GUITHDRAFT_113549 [Guillardia theta CCMP2712]
MECFDMRTHLQMEDLSDESFVSSDSEVDMDDNQLFLEPEEQETSPVWTELEKEDEAVAVKEESDDSKKGKCEVVVIQSRQLPMQNSCAVEITWEKLEQHFHESLPVAASKLGIGKSTMKLVCRKLGLVKWPYKNKGGRQLAAQGSKKYPNVGFGHPLRYNHMWRSYHDYQLSISLHPLAEGIYRA